MLPQPLVLVAAKADPVAVEVSSKPKSTPKVAPIAMTIPIAMTADATEMTTKTPSAISSTAVANVMAETSVDVSNVPFAEVRESLGRRQVPGQG